MSSKYIMEKEVERDDGVWECPSVSSPCLRVRSWWRGGGGGDSWGIDEGWMDCEEREALAVADTGGRFPCACLPSHRVLRVCVSVRARVCTSCVRQVF